LRKENLSIYDISEVLQRKGHKLNPVNISLILKEEGLARLPRRQDDERPPGTRPWKGAVTMKVNLDLQLTLMASSLYRLFAPKIGNRYKNAKSRHIFKNFIDATATVIIRQKDITVRFQKRTQNPFLIAADFDKIAIPVPWLTKKNLQFFFV